MYVLLCTDGVVQRHEQNYYLVDSLSVNSVLLDQMYSSKVLTHVILVNDLTVPEMEEKKERKKTDRKGA